MPLALFLVLALARQCAPAVAPETMLSLVKVESGFDPFAINVNGPKPSTRRPRTAAAAEAEARTLLAQGKNLDLGLAQINSRNLLSLGLTLRTAFEPCANLAAAAKALSAGYEPRGADFASRQLALRIALSRYNTGACDLGFYNGYVARLEDAAAALAPRLGHAPQSPSPDQPQSQKAQAQDVFAPSRTEPSRLVFFPIRHGDSQ